MPAGVPLIVPVDESIDKPVGNVGWISHESTSPPCTVGVIGLIPLSLVKDSELGVYMIVLGAISFTCMVDCCRTEPPRLVAVIV